MSAQAIVIIEDDEDIQELMAYHLEQAGYAVSRTASGEDGLARIASRPPDLVLLDLMLPNMDGLAVCRKLRTDPRTQKIPVIMVTAKGDEPDVIAGLELGADDYITKPFRPKELVARVRAVLRRPPPATGQRADLFRVHDLEIHPGKHEVRVAGRPVDLTFTEFQVLHVLAERPGWVLTRDQIVKAIRGEGYPVTDRAVDVQIVGLRKKLGARAAYIETVRGVGYRFKESRS